MINIIIFSKNRACQLDLFLRSFFVNMLIDYKVSVLYKYTTNEFKLGYDNLINIYGSKVKFIKEKQFKSDLLKLYDRGSTFTLHLTDDNFIKRPILLDNKFEILVKNKDITTLTMSMGKNLRFLNPNEPMPPPESFIDEKNCIYEWAKCKHRVWHFPRGLTTTIYRTVDIIDWFPKLNFKNPNTLEAAMSPGSSSKPYMMCWSKNRLIVLTVNVVQKVYPTMAGNITVEYLNNKWLSGQRIKIDNINKLPEDVLVFYDVDFQFEQRR